MTSASHFREVTIPWKKSQFLTKNLAVQFFNWSEMKTLLNQTYVFYDRDGNVCRTEANPLEPETFPLRIYALLSLPSDTLAPPKVVSSGMFYKNLLFFYFFSLAYKI